MKYLYTILIVVLLASCGPSAEQLAVTAEAAKAETQTAAPTMTPTLTSTPTLTPTLTFTPSPTFIPTITFTPRVRSSNGNDIPHDVPGIEPVGMPESGQSAYFESSAGFVMQLGSGSLKIKSLLFLEKKQELPPGSVLEVHFQNPSDPSTAFVVIVTDLSSDTILVESNLMSASLFACKNYWIDVHVYSDNKSVYELDTLVQWNNSSFC